MRTAPALFLAAILGLSSCGGGDEPERELRPGRVAVGVVEGEPFVAAGVRVATNRIDNAGGIGGALTIELVRGSARELLDAHVRLLVLPCRSGLVEAARLVERRGAIAVAPCDDGVLDPALERVFPTGLSPRAQAEALEEHVGRERIRLLAPATVRGRRVRALLRLREGGTMPVSPDAPEGVQPPEAAPEGTIFATYGFPDPGGRVDEFAERYKAVFGERPASIVAALAADALDVLAYAVELAQSTRPLHVEESFRDGFSIRGVLGEIVYPGETRRPEVEATIVRIERGRLRPVVGR